MEKGEQMMAELVLIDFRNSNELKEAQSLEEKS